MPTGRDSFGAPDGRQHPAADSVSPSPASEPQPRSAPARVDHNDTLPLTEHAFSMLFMRSARNSKDDLTARARIRDSAIVYFGRHGFQSATVRAIAADAAVSPALVIHHFGSKDGLRSACDDYLTFCIDDLTQHAASHLEAVDLIDLMSRTPQLTPLVPYMIQTITEGGDFAAKLWDRLVQDTETYLDAAVSAGKVRPTGDDGPGPRCSAPSNSACTCSSRYMLPTPPGGLPGEVDIACDLGQVHRSDLGAAHPRDVHQRRVPRSVRCPTERAGSR